MTSRTERARAGLHLRQQIFGSTSDQTVRTGHGSAEAREAMLKKMGLPVTPDPFRPLKKDEESREG